jgi:ubiquinone/menaquinone biosynthesis C-methylase UbiE
MPFNDHFSALANDYARHRPQYPDSLYQWLASIAPAQTLAWDCATGNGQAATGLAGVFDRVIATDGSQEQITAALPHERIEYRVATAEESGLEDHSVDICTVAQALHWFDFDRFYAEVRRVVRQNGIIAAWTYAYVETEADSKLKTIMDDFYYKVRPYFPAERRWVDEEYRMVPFPFDELPSASIPTFFMEAVWNLDDVLGYYRSWSGVKEFQKQHGISPLDDVADALRAVWQQSDQEPIRIRWRLHLRVGRV